MFFGLIFIIMILAVGFVAGMLVGYFLGKRAAARRQEGFPVVPMETGDRQT